MSPPASDKTLSYIVEGPVDAPTLVFIHGWPDDESLWCHQVDILKTRYRCVAVTLPNYGASVDRNGGCDFDEIVERLNRTVTDLSCDRVTLITHDWGAYIGYLYEKKYPERVRTMIAMDVGGHVQLSAISQIAMFVSYQWTLISLWLVGGVMPPVGTWLTRKFAGLLKVPPRQASTLHSRCNYPYFYYWRSTLLPWMRTRLLGNYRPKCRVLYIYGGDKPLMFHSPRWLDIVVQCGGKNVCISEGSHWFMEAQAEQTNSLLSEWCEQS